MKQIQVSCLLGTLMLGAAHVFADAPAATVTQTFDKSTHTLSSTGKGEAASAGTMLRDGEYLETGKTSLAEVKLANQTIARLGPSTVFKYSASAHEADLQSGTLLFSKPKDGQELTIKTPGVTAAVTGTTGFVEKEGSSVIFGVIEGTVHVTVGTANAVLRAGKMLVCAPGSAAQVISFDVPHFVSTSSLFHRFSSQLPNEKSVEREISEYHNLAARGFIATTPTLPSIGDQHSSLATVAASPQIIGHETSGHALYAMASTAKGHPLLAASNTSFTSSSGITINSGLGGGTLALNGSGSSYSGSTITVNGAPYTGGSIVSSGTLVVGGGGGTVNTGTIGTTGGSVGGVFVINQGGTGTGALNVGTNSGGTLIGSGTISLGSGTTLTGGTLIVSGGGVPLTGTSTGLTVTGTSTSSTQGTLTTIGGSH